MKTSRSIALTGLTLTIVTASPLMGMRHQSHPSMTVQEFSAGSQMDKKRILGQLASHRQSLPAVELHELLNIALADDSPAVRNSALWAIAGRLVNVKGTPDALTRWRAERDTLVTFRERLLSLLQDVDATVRQGAIAAITSFEIDRDSPLKASRSLRPETARVLAARFDQEPDGVTRGHIVSTFAWYTPQSAASKDSLAVLEKALSDTHPAPVQAALIGVSEQHINALLPKAVTLLSHKRHEIRTTAAQTVAAFGAEARVYIPQLQTALANETDVIAKKSLEGALRVIAR